MSYSIHSPWYYIGLNSRKDNWTILVNVRFLSGAHVDVFIGYRSTAHWDDMVGSAHVDKRRRWRIVEDLRANPLIILHRSFFSKSSWKASAISNAIKSTWPPLFPVQRWLFFPLMVHIPPLFWSVPHSISFNSGMYFRLMIARYRVSLFCVVKSWMSWAIFSARSCCLPAS